MGIDESLAIAVSARSLAWADYKTMPVEFVAALAGASELASSIYRAKQSDKLALHRAILLLAHQAQRTGKRKRLYLSPQQAQAFAAAALTEVLNPKCQMCKGACVVASDTKRVTCSTCNGSGVHRYADGERAANLSLIHI